MNLTPEQISDFLKLNPDYFASHPEMLTEITVPHPYSSQAISLGERQVLALRDKSGGLELKLREFIQTPKQLFVLRLGVRFRSHEDDKILWQLLDGV